MNHDDRDAAIAQVRNEARGIDREPMTLLARAEAEAARDRAERADPGTARLVEARDFQAAGGLFADADSTQRLISAERAEREPVQGPLPPGHVRCVDGSVVNTFRHSERLQAEARQAVERENRAGGSEIAPPERDAQRAAERAERREREDRETDAQLRHDRFPFWSDRDRPEPGPTDRPGVLARAQQMQGQTRDRAHWRGDRPRPGYADRMVGRTRGRGEQR
jgi:hypothetical protein